MLVKVLLQQIRAQISYLSKEVFAKALVVEGKNEICYALISFTNFGKLLM